jgi:hypothetical protein
MSTETLTHSTGSGRAAQDQLTQYAAIAWRPGEIIEVRCIPAKREGPGAPVSFWCRAEDLAGQRERLEALNVQEMNVYAGILPRKSEGGKTDADCAGGFAAWADFDGADPREAWRKATAAGLPRPSMAVHSGHGAHLFWALTERTDPAAISALVGDLAALLGSDATVRNPSRILRLPGFKNWKAPVAESALLHADAACRYDFAALRAAVPILVPAVEQYCGDGNRPESAASVLRRATAYMATVPGTSVGGRNQAAFRCAANLRQDFGLSDADAWPLLADWNRKNLPPLNEKELRAVFQSAGRHAKHAPGEKAATRPDRPDDMRADDGAPDVVISPTPADDDLSDMRGELAAQREGTRRTIPLPWKRLSQLSRALRPGTVCVLAGPPGTGKSFFTATIAFAVHAAEVPWRFLPLEDRKTDFKWRLLAMLAGDYHMIEDDPEGAAWRQEHLERFAATLEQMTPFVCENPRTGVKGPDGKTAVPPLPYGAVLDWIAAACGQSARVLFVDPISQIDFEGREPWRAEGQFIRSALALMADASATLVLVAHTIKRGGRNAALPLTLEDVQGSAMIGRLCHTALILDAHESKTSAVYRAHGLREDVTHNRTVLIAKTRHGSGARQRIAFVQRADAPVFEELGVIAPRRSGGDAPDSASSGAKGEDEHWANRI